MKPYTSKLLLLALALASIAPAGLPLNGAEAAPPALPAAATFADPAFQQVWDRTDSLVATELAKRSWFWGPTPLTMISEKYVDAPDGSGQRLVQYFDKSRMEINNPAADRNSPFYVTNGLLTVELISGRMQVGNNTFEQRAPATNAIAGDFGDPNAPTYASFRNVSNALGEKADPKRMGQAVTAVLNRDGSVTNDPGKAVYPKADVVYYDETSKHNVPRAFWEFLNQRGPIKAGDVIRTEQLITPWFYASGLPISDAYWATVKINGKPTDTLIQVYERRVLTYVPTNQPAFQVEMGNIGAHYRDWRYKGPGRAAGFPLSGPHPGYGFNVWMFDLPPGQLDQTLQLAKGAGFDWVRQQVVWADYQPSAARITWGRLDPIVEAAARNGVKLTLGIVKSPPWAAADAKAGMPGNPFTFGAFMSQMAARYKGRVAAYEIWNEQNMQWETGGPVNVAPYVELLRIGYSAIKFEDPNAVVLSGGLTPTGVMDPNLAIDDVEYLKRFYAYQNGIAKGYFDVLGAHPGSNANSPDQKWPDVPGTGACPAPYTGTNCWKDHNSFYFRRIEQLREVMELNGDANKQMWLTEFGWTTANQARGYEYGNLISEQTQADYLVRAFQKGKNDYPWMGVMFVWNLNFSTLPWLTAADEKYPWAVLNRDFSPRPAYTALKNMPK